jgi:PhoPQ-activated pathogenicity-related protein
MVIDLLNIEPSFVHHWQAYGFWAPAIKDYQERGIMDWAGTPRYRELMKEVEPFSYRDRLTMPKFLINSAGDQFFLPDSSQFYFDDLHGEKYLRYVPNTDHSLRNSDARQSLIAFYDAFLRNQARPKFSWKFEKNGSIRVKTTDQPSEVKLWQATNPNARDFRLMTIGPAYQSTVLNEEGAAGYVAKVAKPAKGWTAYFVELTFPSGGKYPFKFTTPVRVEPDVLPYPPPKPAHAVSATSAAR